MNYAFIYSLILYKNNPDYKVSFIKTIKYDYYKSTIDNRLHKHPHYCKAKKDTIFDNVGLPMTTETRKCNKSAMYISIIANQSKLENEELESAFSKLKYNMVVAIYKDPDWLITKSLEAKQIKLANYILNLKIEDVYQIKKY